MLIDSNVHSQGMKLIILIAAREMMLAGISKDTVSFITKQLEIKKEELLKKIDQIE